MSLQLKIAQQDQHEEEDEEDVTASGAVRVLLIDSISLYNSSGGVQEDHFPIAVKEQDSSSYVDETNDANTFGDSHLRVSNKSRCLS